MIYNKCSKVLKNLYRNVRNRGKEKLLKILALVIFVITTGIYIRHCIVDEDSTKPVRLDYVVVHIDLKGSPPKLSFLKSMLKEIKKLGANALLMEYEDMFPYENNISMLSKPRCYTKADLKNFLVEAKQLDIEIIPLIQTFGHMEFVLKLNEFKDLRENPKSPDSICPSRLRGFVLISEMLRQVIEFHNNVAPLKHIHIGCDEVYNINICKSCKAKRLSKYDIYAKHVNAVSNIVSNISFNTTVLIWDDMLREMNISLWKNFTMNPKLELVYWEYHNGQNKSHRAMFYYHHHFQGIWIASAFKGADGWNNMIPDYKKRTSNILSWLKFIEKYIFGGEKEVYNFRGIILTGWSRYKHFYPLVEFLPVAYRSLITQLLLVNQFKKGMPLSIDWKKDWNKIFEQHFIDDYYRLVECKETDTCILNSTILLYDSVEKYDIFLKSSKYVLKKGKIDSDRSLYNKLFNIENYVKRNMKPFYTSDVIIQFLNNKSLLF